MDEVMEIAREHNLIVIEDAAEAHGAKYKGRMVGSIGHLAIFSFFGNKVITTGEGGMVVTDSEEMANKINLLKNHGMNPQKRYWHPVIGYNYRMTNLQAAIGVAQLARIDEIIQKKKQIFDFYKNSCLMSRYPGLDINPEKEGTEQGKWLVSIILPKWATVVQRDELCARLRTKGIDSRPYFYPLHEMPPYVSARTVNSQGGSELSATKSLSERGFNLPSSNKLREEDVLRIVAALNEELERLFKNSVHGAPLLLD